MDECSKLLSTRKIWCDGPFNVTEIVSSVRSLVYHQKLMDLLREIHLENQRNERKYPPITEKHKNEPHFLIVEAVTHFIKHKSELQECEADQVATLACLETLKNILAEQGKFEISKCYSISLLTEENRRLAHALVAVMQNLYHSNGLDLRSFTKIYCQLENIPLELLWLFQEKCLIESTSYIIKNIQNPQAISKLTSSISVVICYGGGDSVAEDVCVGLLSPLVALVHNAAADTASSEILSTQKQALKVVLSSTMRKVNERLQSPQKDKVTNGTSSCEKVPRPIDIYHRLASHPVMDSPNSEIVLKFFSNQLADLLSFSPSSTLNQAFSLQNEWSYCKIPQYLQQMLTSMLQPLEAKNALDIIRTILKMGEVNWRNVLACISVFCVTKDESGLYMREFVAHLVHEALNDGCHETLILALLTARQCAAEGCGFPPYGEWFDSMFGVRGTWGKDQKGPSVRNFRLLMSLITDLVPMETVSGLRAHISHPPQAPANSVARGMLSDYLNLAKTRLSDFGVCLSEQGGLFKVGQLGGSEASHSRQSVAEAEVELVITHFERTGEIMKTLLEASVFRKRYLEQTFLPELLKPRILPKKPDTRMKVIKLLICKGLISSSTYNDFAKRCEEEEGKVVNGDTNTPTKNNDCLAVLSSELQKHLELIQRTKDGKIGCNLMWKFVKDSLSSISQCLQKNLERFPVDFDCDLPFIEKDSKCIKSEAFAGNFNPSHDNEIITAVLRTCEKGIELFPFKERIQWIQLFLSLLDLRMQFRLYQRVYHLSVKPSLDSNQCQMNCIATIIFCINIDPLEFPQVVLKSTEDNNLSTNIFPDRKIVSFLEFLSCLLPLSSKYEMEHSFKFCEAFLSCVESHNLMTKEEMENAPLICGIPTMLMTKYLFLLKRYQNAEIGNPSHLSFSLLSHREIWPGIIKSSEVQLDQWLSWELHIDPVSDIFPSLESRKNYLLHCLLNFCVQYPSCNVLSVVKDTLKAFISTWSSENDSLKSNSSNFLMLLSFQEFLSYKLECVACSSARKCDSEIPWLLNYWINMERTDGTVISNDKKENEDGIFLRIYHTLPPYLILKNDPKMKVSDSTRSAIVHLINNYLRNTLCDGSFLPLSLMLHLVTGITDYDPEPEVTLNHIIKLSPSFRIALIVHHLLLLPKLGRLKSASHLKDLGLVLKIIGGGNDPATRNPSTMKEPSSRDLGLAVWTKQKAQFPSPEIALSELVLETEPLEKCVWVLYFDMLSLGWKEIFEQRPVNSSCFNSLSVIIQRQPALIKSLDSLLLEKLHRAVPHEFLSSRRILAAAHSVRKLLTLFLQENQPEESEIDTWFIYLRTLLSASNLWIKCSENASMMSKLDLDIPLHSILASAAKVANSRGKSLSEELMPEYLSGLAGAVTEGIMFSL